MYLIRFDKVKNIPYNKHKNRFITWLRIINATSLEEIRKYSKGDEIMSESDKFIAEWCRESSKNNFEQYIAEKERKAAAKAEKQGILETAKSMLIKGYDINEIVDITKLDIKEIQKLKVQIN